MNKRLIVIGATVALLVTACGGDDKGSSSAGDSNSTFCQRAQKVDDLSNGLDPTADKDTFSKQYDQLISAAKDAVKVAPASIKANMQTQLATIEAFQAIAKDDDWDIEKIQADPKYTALDTSQLETDDVVTQYLATTCGIGDASDDTSSSEATTVPAGGSSGSQEDAIATGLKTAFPKLSDDDAHCLAQKGLSMQNVSDQSKFVGILQACGLTPDALLPS